MPSRSELDALRQLEADVPGMTVDMNAFFRAFEDRAEMILGVADEGEQEYVLDCLMTMLRRSGISQKDGFKGPTLH